MKPGKTLWKISVTTSLEAGEAVMESLARIFKASPSAYFDLKKRTNLVSVYQAVLPSDSPKKIRDDLEKIEKCGLKIGSGKISIAKIRREDWAESWKRHFKPFEIGKSLLIKPGWSRKRVRRGQAVVVLDPGLSFGTGQHPTTLFCLRETVRFKSSREDATSLLDLGTGSGILAIAAAKLGFEPVHAIDFDPVAVRVARTNARKNHVVGKIHITRGDVSKLRTNPSRRYDVVCANLISNLLIAERKKLIAQLKPGGILILAGILKVEFSIVQKAFESCGLTMVSARTEKEWRSGSFHQLKAHKIG
ncbi:MAG TPA: 50S ribosomal protein L11 methyltransferase [Verrucomicrobiae bacterium]|jgi:ribosomal protein L11 methyltransferase